jgi:hypothetical protein
LNLGHVLLEHSLVAGAAFVIQPQRKEEREGTQIRFANTTEAGFVSASFVAASINLSQHSKEFTVSCALLMHGKLGGTPKQRTCTEVAQPQHLGLVCAHGSRQSRRPTAPEDAQDLCHHNEV